MAKDDYYVIVAKILVFLYKRLKGKEKAKVSDYICPLTKSFPINEDYMDYVIELNDAPFLEGRSRYLSNCVNQT